MFTSGFIRPFPANVHKCVVRVRPSLGDQAIALGLSIGGRVAVNLDATSTYYAARLILKNNLTVGTPSCAGCDQAACLVMNSIRIAGPTGDIAFLQLPGSNGANWALWQGGQGANCAAVPVRNRAWGQLKGLYR